AANAFGWDVVAATDLTFRRDGTDWSLESPVDLEADWAYDAPDAEAPGAPLVQRNAWFWEEGQELPHRISPDVYEKIKNQVKVSTYLFLQTDPGELLLITDLPNRRRPFRVLSALVDTDWYPASYPWHCVIELDPSESEIRIDKGESLCRLVVVKRDHYFAQEMSSDDFERFFQRGQDWLATYGREGEGDMRDITRTYVKQQKLSTFSVII
ncbi:MAG: hypothetical protein AAF517_09660, partial [Planctomycetota bacterium]